MKFFWLSIIKYLPQPIYYIGHPKRRCCISTICFDELQLILITKLWSIQSMHLIGDVDGALIWALGVKIHLDSAYESKIHGTIADDVKCRKKMSWSLSQCFQFFLFFTPLLYRKHCLSTMNGINFFVVVLACVFFSRHFVFIQFKRSISNFEKG